MPIYKQSGMYTCWASSSAMIISYFNDDSLNIEDEIIRKIKGDNIDEKATLKDTVEAINMFTDKKAKYIRFTPSLNTIKENINNDNPIIVALKNISHAVIIIGYNDDEIIYIDPANGKRNIYKYDYVEEVFDMEDYVIFN